MATGYFYGEDYELIYLQAKIPINLKIAWEDAKLCLSFLAKSAFDDGMIGM